MKTLLSSFGYLKEFFCFHDKMVRKMKKDVTREKTTVATNISVYS